MHLQQSQGYSLCSDRKIIYMHMLTLQLLKICRCKLETTIRTKNSSNLARQEGTVFGHLYLFFVHNLEKSMEYINVTRTSIIHQMSGMLTIS